MKLNESVYGVILSKKKRRLSCFNMQLHCCLANKVQAIFQNMIKHQLFIRGYPQERSTYAICIHEVEQAIKASGAPSRN